MTRAGFSEKTSLLLFPGNPVSEPDWHPHDERKTKLLASSGAVLGTYPVGSYPQAVAFDGANVWVTNLVSNTVTMIPTN
jgi:DNA-binding beta-propeller fold protein YncE